jgi:hypothetical protein
MGEPDRTWTEIGERYIESEERREEIVRVAATLNWHELDERGHIRGPMSPVLLLKEIIEQMEFPKVTSVAWGGDAIVYPDGPEHAYYSLVGVESHYSNADVRCYLLDIGTGAVPLFMDIVDRAKVGE